VETADKGPDVSGESRASSFAAFPALEGYLDGLGLFRMNPGLERIFAVLGRLGLTRPPFLVIQVVGTNGKGSTSAMLAALAQAHGLRVGLHTSPHFLSVRERIRINGAMAEEAFWVRLANRLLRSGGRDLSYFEAVTALAVMAFAETGVQLAVMETGLGGSFDATTALAADLVVLTPFALDHQAVLGPALRDIARDKAGAIRPRVPVLSAPQDPEAWAEIRRSARDKEAPLIQAENGEDALPPDLSLGLEGLFQRSNAALALAAWRIARNLRAGEKGRQAPIPGGYRPGPLTAPERRGLAAAWLPGRLQAVPPLPAAKIPALPESGLAGIFSPSPLGWPPLLLDGAHNSHAFAALGRSLSRAGILPAAVIFACLEDKNPEEILPHLRALSPGPVFVPPIPDNRRAIPPEILAARLGPPAVPAASLGEALRRAAGHMAKSLPEAFAGARPDRPLLLCGSLYLLGTFFALRPDCLENTPPRGTGE
jgi:dihydrofolate synthase/folylpolyglutamate synthase